MEADPTLRVEVVYALAHEQVSVVLSLPAGSTAADAVHRSGLVGRFPEIARAPFGVYGRVVAGDAPLCDGDRVEIYRPLMADPKQARRRRAARKA